MQPSGDVASDADVDQDDEDDDLLEEYFEHAENHVFRDMETTRRVTSEMGLAVHGDLGCYQHSQKIIHVPVFHT